MTSVAACCFAIVAISLCGGCKKPPTTVGPSSTSKDSPAKTLDPMLLARAEAGDAAAQYQVASFYEESDPKNTQRILFWTRKAAEQGNAEAQTRLGECYRVGFGVEQDDAKAFFWTRKAALQGLAEAQYLLGRDYRYGDGIRRDAGQAKLWIRKAADQGYMQAEGTLGDAYADGDYSLGVHVDYAQEEEWYQRAATHGDFRAASSLGDLYYEGRGVSQNYGRAADEYREADAKATPDFDGDPHAEAQLGSLYEHGQGVPQNYEQAAIWYRKAAQADDATAQFNLGMMFAKSIGVPQNYAEAYFWFDIAASGTRYSSSVPEQVIRARNDAASHLSKDVLQQTQERALKWSETHPHPATANPQ